jgi:hypothetical protein
LDPSLNSVNQEKYQKTFEHLKSSVFQIQQ